MIGLLFEIKLNKGKANILDSKWNFQDSSSLLQNIMRSQGTLSLDPQVLQRLIAALCNPRQPEYDLCTNVLFTLVGEDYEQNDVVRYKKI